MYDIPFDRSFLQLSNSIRHVMPSTDRKLELTAKALMAQPVLQPAVCCSGLNETDLEVVACGSNSGCMGKCAVMSFCELTCYGLLKQRSVNQASNCQLIKIDLVLWIHLINKLKTVSAGKLQNVNAFLCLSLL